MQRKLSKQEVSDYDESMENCRNGIERKELVMHVRLGCSSYLYSLNIVTPNTDLIPNGKIITRE
jgi:hypothetical protein